MGDDGGRMEEDWSIEVGPVTHDECLGCGRSHATSRYCEQCRSTGKAEDTAGVHVGYETGPAPATAWEGDQMATSTAASTPALSARADVVRADGGQSQSTAPATAGTDWPLVVLSIIAAGANLFVAALYTSTVGTVTSLPVVIITAVATLFCLLFVTTEVIGDG